jgi:hypothetical protein
VIDAGTRHADLDPAQGFPRSVVAATAAILYVIAWLSPWAIVIGGGVWVARILLRRRANPSR